MNLDDNQKTLIKKIKSRFIFNLVSLSKLPLAIITGTKIENINQKECQTSVKYSYLNKNPFKSTYFAVQSMAAELSTGALALLSAGGLNSDISFILVGMQGQFSKKAKGKTIFICKDGEKLQKAVEKARNTNDQQKQLVKTIGYNDDGEEISKFEFSWSFKKSGL